MCSEITLPKCQALFTQAVELTALNDSYGSLCGQSLDYDSIRIDAAPSYILTSTCKSTLAPYNLLQDANPDANPNANNIICVDKARCGGH